MDQIPPFFFAPILLLLIIFVYSIRAYLPQLHLEKLPADFHPLAPAKASSLAPMPISDHPVSDHLSMSLSSRNMLVKVRLLVPPMLEKFHKGQLGRVAVIGGRAVRSAYNQVLQPQPDGLAYIAQPCEYKRRHRSDRRTAGEAHTGHAPSFARPSHWPWPWSR
jgi:hypothetical protein